MKKGITVLSIVILTSMIMVYIFSPRTIKIQDTSPDFKKNVSVCYEIFPIAYRDSNNDGIGDIAGITQSLPYLQHELMIDCIWITPIHPSPSYHKYDVIDYYDIDQDFGTLEDYATLIQEAHKRDIRVIMDFVINHTSIQHKWFREFSNGNKEYENYYNTITTEEFNNLQSKNGWHTLNEHTYYFGSFWHGMPDLNYENKKVRKSIYNIAKYWIDFGVDGFRIDAAKHLYDKNEFPTLDTTIKNIDFFKEFNQVVKKYNKDIFIVSEVWADSTISAKYLEGMDAIFNFNFSNKVVDAINNANSNIINRNIAHTYNNYFTIREDAIINNFIKNHDQVRTLSAFGNNINKSKQAAAILFTQPGISWIYYGEEIGMKGKKPDELIREPFKWEEYGTGVINTSWKIIEMNADVLSLQAQQQDNKSLYSRYKELIALKQGNNILKHGSYERVKNNHKQFYIYKRVHDTQELLIIHNLSLHTQHYNTDNHNISTLLYATHQEIDMHTFSGYSSKVFSLK